MNVKSLKQVAVSDKELDVLKILTNSQTKEAFVDCGGS